MRTFVIGDIHSCLTELIALLGKAGVRAEDQVVSVGDFLDRGPDPVGVYELLRFRPNTTCLLGNHEDKLIRGRSHGLRQAISQQITRARFGSRFDELLDWLETLSLYVRVPNADTVVVHAGYLGDTDDRRMLLRGIRPEDNPFKTDYRWQDQYAGPDTVIYGHHVVPQVNAAGQLINLDTGCVRGGTLSGIWLPDRTAVSVPALTNYWAHEKRQHQARSRAENPARNQAVQAEVPTVLPSLSWSDQCSPEQLAQLRDRAHVQYGTNAAASRELSQACDQADELVVVVAVSICREGNALIDAIRAALGKDPVDVPRSDMPLVADIVRARTTTPFNLMMTFLRAGPTKLTGLLRQRPLAELHQVGRGQQ